MIVIASSSPTEANTNASIVEHIHGGFEELLGGDQVHLADFRNITESVDVLKPKLLVLAGSPAAVETDFRAIANACRAANTCLAFWTLEDPYEFDFNVRFAALADIVFTNEATAVDFYDRGDVHHLPLATPASFVQPLSEMDGRATDFFFCGVAYLNRQRVVIDIAPIVARRRSLIAGYGWPSLDAAITVHGRMSHEELLRRYASSVCVLNIGRDLSIANSRNIQPTTPGPRTFEAAAVGCVQMYHRPGSTFSEYFAPDAEMLTFDSVSEFEEKFDALMSSPDLALGIAGAAQRKVAAYHTYKHRAAEIMRKVGA